MLIIGLTGFMRSGKDSVAQVLEKDGFRRYGFADALRTMARAINPMIALAGAPERVFAALFAHALAPGNSAAMWRYADLESVLGYERAKEIPDFRGFLQRLGTEGVRGTFGPNAWVRALKNRLDEDTPERVVIADVRFHSEADFITKEGGELWRITRPGTGGNSHPSELEIPALSAAREIVNDSSLVALERTVSKTLTTVLKKSAGS